MKGIVKLSKGLQCKAAPGCMNSLSVTGDDELCSECYAEVMKLINDLYEDDHEMLDETGEK